MKITRLIFLITDVMVNILLLVMLLYHLSNIISNTDVVAWAGFMAMFWVVMKISEVWDEWKLEYKQIKEPK